MTKGASKERPSEGAICCTIIGGPPEKNSPSENWYLHCLIISRLLFAYRCALRISKRYKTRFYPVLENQAATFYYAFHLGDVQALELHELLSDCYQHSTVTNLTVSVLVETNTAQVSSFQTLQPSRSFQDLEAPYASRLPLRRSCSCSLNPLNTSLLLYRGTKRLLIRAGIYEAFGGHSERSHLGRHKY